jgi:hypothetical protein
VVLVVYDEGGPAASIGVRDGLDLAFAGFAPPLDATVPQTFTFPASTSDRTATLATLAGTVLGPDAPGPRANQLSITFSPVGEPVVLDNPWQSNQGFEFDALNSSILIPAGAASMTVQAISGGPNGSPASLAWIGAALSVPAPPQQAAGETATGFGIEYPNSSNWFMYTPYTTSKVDLVQGPKHNDVGDIFMSRSGGGASAKTTIRITLHAGWSWDAVEEVLKIQPFDSAPKDYVQPGAFLYKFTAPNLAKDPSTSVSFSGQTATVVMPGTKANYGIHADVLGSP